MPKSLGSCIRAPHVRCGTRQNDIVFCMPAGAVKTVKRRLKRIAILIESLHLYLVPKAQTVLALVQTLNPSNVEVTSDSGLLGALFSYGDKMGHPSRCALPTVRVSSRSLFVHVAPGRCPGALLLSISPVVLTLPCIRANLALRCTAVFGSHTSVKLRDGLALLTGVTELLRNQAT